jgi:hypothetical protein
MKPLGLLLVGVVVGWAASGVDWTQNAVGQEGSILTERLAPPEAVATGAAVAMDPAAIQPFLAQFAGRYQIFADAGACYRVDTVTGCVWHITLHMPPRIVAAAVEAEFAR